MLADVSEAVTHSMHDPTQEEVEEALEKVFQNRWDDGQFLNSTLTYEELLKVLDGFARVWRTLHHERLKYPATTTGKMPVPPTPLNSVSNNINTGAGTANAVANTNQLLPASGADNESSENGLGI
jgi:hypothetical protein